MKETYRLTDALNADVIQYAEEHRFEELLGVTLPKQRIDYSANYNVAPVVKEPYPPELEDLVRLHQLVRARRVFTILEFGVGYSSIVLADALERNARDFASAGGSEKIRRNNPFELHSVDSSAEYIEILRKRIPEALRPRVHLHYSRCVMGTFEGRVCHYYEQLPTVSPDFIYLDAPGQFDVDGEVRGFSTRSQDSLPMSADLAAIEHFLLPGTLVLVDGRTANARFLRTAFRRDWEYRHDERGDVHTFELVEAPLGVYNEAMLRYCLGASYFEKLERS